MNGLARAPQSTAHPGIGRRWMVTATTRWITRVLARAIHRIDAVPRSTQGNASTTTCLIFRVLEPVAKWSLPIPAIADLGFCYTPWRVRESKIGNVG